MRARRLSSGNVGVGHLSEVQLFTLQCNSHRPLLEEALHMANSDRVVVTAAVGPSFAEMGRITHPLMERYASRCRADFVVFSEPLVATRTGLPGRFEKLQLHDLLTRYDRALFLDNDVLVSPLAPDVFELVAPGVFGMVNEEKFERASLDRQLTEQVLGKTEWSAPYFNSGVMLADRSHAFLFDPEYPPLQLWQAYARTDSRYHPAGEDQAYLNYLLSSSKVPFVDLGHHFNFTRVRRDGHLRFRSFFVHYAGPSGFRYGKRLEQLRRDAAIFNSEAAFALARRFPRLRWAMDRCDPDFVRYLMQRYVMGNRQS